jgi:hypothetical protein
VALFVERAPDYVLQVGRCPVVMMGAIVASFVLWKRGERRWGGALRGQSEWTGLPSLNAIPTAITHFPEGAGTRPTALVGVHRESTASAQAKRSSDGQVGAVGGSTAPWLCSVFGYWPGAERGGEGKLHFCPSTKNTIVLLCKPTLGDSERNKEVDWKNDAGNYLRYGSGQGKRGAEGCSDRPAVW